MAHYFTYLKHDLVRVLLALVQILFMQKGRLQVLPRCQPELELTRSQVKLTLMPFQHVQAQQEFHLFGLGTVTLGASGWKCGVIHDRHGARKVGISNLQLDNVNPS